MQHEALKFHRIIRMSISAVTSDSFDLLLSIPGLEWNVLKDSTFSN